MLAWFKAEGETVQAGEDLLEIALEKTVYVVEAPAAGMLAAIYVEPGAIVPTDEVFGWVAVGDEQAPEHAPLLLGWDEAVAPAPPELTARLAEGMEEAAPSGHHAPEITRAHGAALRNQLRRVTALRMERSWMQAPKVDLFADVDFTTVAAHRQALKDAGEDAPSYNVYIAHAVMRAFTDMPEFNFNVIDGEAEPLEGIHVGMAVAVGDNLVTVSLKDIGGLSVQEMQTRFKGLIRKALRMTLTHEEMYGSSLTVTNLGEWDITAFTAVLNPPEAYILAIGKVEERVVAVDGQPAVRLMCTFVLSFDHRAVDGAPASRLLQRIKQHMEAGPEGQLNN